MAAYDGFNLLPMPPRKRITGACKSQKCCSDMFGQTNRQTDRLLPVFGHFFANKWRNGQNVWTFFSKQMDKRTEVRTPQILI